jgi:hypothetical protein
MKTLTKLVISLALVFQLVACTKPEISVEKYQQIETGMSYQEVVEILGDGGESVDGASALGVDVANYRWQIGETGYIEMSFINDSLVVKKQSGLKSEVH